jgi:predicted nucleic-acid-binding protein
MNFVDTNYFLRLVLGDVESQFVEVKRVFEEGMIGEIKLFTSLVVFFEVYWVLTSFYRQKKEKIISVLEDILKMSFVALPERIILFKALGLFGQTNLSLEDCFNVFYAEEYKSEKFLTFDRKLAHFFSRGLQKK